MKKSMAVVGAVALASVLAVTAAGCASSTRNLASLSSNWYYDSGFKKIQPTFTEDNAERLTYKVTQSESEITNSYYSVEHAEGTYTTEFYAKKMTADDLALITDADWHQAYKEAVEKEGGYMYLYYYATELSIPSVTYKFGSQEKSFGEQSVVTESYFLSVDNYLQPVYSYRSVNRVIPANLQASYLDDTYRQVDMVFESFYTISGNNVKTVITDNLAEGEKESDFAIGGLNSHSNSVFDVAYMDITVRAMRNISGSFSQLIGVYTPGLQVRDYTVSSTSAAIFDGEDAQKQLSDIQALFEEKGLFTPELKDKDDPEQGETTLTTAAATVSYNGGSYSGVSQTYWFAVDDSARTIMVKYSEPLTYNLGTLNYVLTGIDSYYV